MTTPPPVRFGEDFELDRRAYQLRRADAPIKLERIPMEILLLLVERRGELVTREDIAGRVWGRDADVDLDNNINGAVRKIRQALRDDVEQPRFVETVTGRGYRFIAPLREAEPEPAAPAAEPAAPPRPRSRPWRVAAGIAAAVVVLAAAVAGVVLWGRARTAPPGTGRVMLAVLPFRNLTGDPQQEYFSDGFTDEMIARLGAGEPERLGVIAPASVMRYKAGQEPLEKIERDLGVQYVLAGSVRRDGDRVRVTAQLIRAGDQTEVWANEYDRTVQDLLDIQGEVAGAIAQEIETRLGATPPAAKPAPRLAPPFDAYDAYLRGVVALNARDLGTAAGFLEQAVAKDPVYAKAYAALAEVYALDGAYTTRPPAPFDSKARAAALRALELDSTLAEAHAALALVVQNYDWNWQLAEREFRRAIALNPSYATAHQWYAEHLMWLGRFDEALRESERARELDPQSLIIAADNGAILYFSRDYDRAIEKLRSVLNLDPQVGRAHLIVDAYLVRGRFADALADLDQDTSARLNPWTLGLRAEVYGRAGQPALAQRALRALVAATKRDPVRAWLFFQAYLGMGDKEAALTWLERAYAEHDNAMTTLKVDPLLDPLRGDPRFQRLLVRVGLAGGE